MTDARTTPSAPEPHPVAPNSVAVGSGAGDVLAALERLADDLERKRTGAFVRLDAINTIARLRAAIAETRAGLGEVSVREQWGRGTRSQGVYVVSDHLGRGLATHVRTITTTTHVTDWIEETP